MEETKRNESIRASIFMERKTFVHVRLKNGFIFNGLILEVSDNFFVLFDKKTGKEYFILFEELKQPLEVYKEDGNKK